MAVLGPATTSSTGMSLVTISLGPCVSLASTVSLFTYLIKKFRVRHQMIELRFVWVQIPTSTCVVPRFERGFGVSVLGVGAVLRPRRGASSSSTRVGSPSTTDDSSSAVATSSATSSTTASGDSVFAGISSSTVSFA